MFTVEVSGKNVRIRLWYYMTSAGDRESEKECDKVKVRSVKVAVCMRR